MKSHTIRTRINVTLIPLIAGAALSILSCTGKSPALKIREMARHFANKVFELDESQQASLDDIVTSALSSYKEITPINQNMYLVLETALKTGKLDVAKVKDLISSKQLQESVLIQKEADRFAALLASLSEDQRQNGLRYLETLRDRSKAFQFMLGQNEQ